MKIIPIHIYTLLEEALSNIIIISKEDEILWHSTSLKNHAFAIGNTPISKLKEVFSAEVCTKIHYLRGICDAKTTGFLVEVELLGRKNGFFEVKMEKIISQDIPLYRIEYKQMTDDKLSNEEMLQHEIQILNRKNKSLMELNQDLQDHNRVQEKQIEKLTLENQYLLENQDNQEDFDFAVISAEKHLAKRELKESEKRLELALAAGQLGIWDWNIQTGDTVFNDRWVNMLGYELNEISPNVSSFLELIHPEDAPKIDELLKKHLAGEIPFFEIELRLKGKDGKYHWVYDRGMVVSRDPKGNPMRALGIHVYINDNKQTSQALIESEKKFRNVFNFNTIGIIIADTTGKTLDANAQVSEILGYSLAELKELKPIEFSHPDDLPRERELAKEMIATGKDFFRMEKRYIRKDKQIIWANFSLTIIRDENKEFQMAIALLEDITEKKMAEQQLKQQNAVLLKVNEELNNFAYRTSHDLRAPLTSLMGLVQITEMADSDKERAKYLKLMSNQLNYLDGVIKEIIEYRKVAAGEMNVSDIAFQEKIETVMQHYEFLPHYDKIDKKIKIEQTASFASDEIKINIILNNLISNAIKYSDKNKTNPFIYVGIKADTEGATIEIRDNGIGIPSQHITSIFKMFFRASVQQMGTGLGLYIVKEALEKLNGTIEVESVEGKGTCFRLFIPNMNS